MRRSVIIQARMGSTRLPGKVLMPLAGKPVLGHVVTRARAAKQVDNWIVATSTLPADDPIAAFCEGAGVPCVRGSENDVLSRYLVALELYPSDLAVRITADCPLVDPELIDEMLHSLQSESGTIDYISNTQQPRRIPHGLDVEAFRTEALKRAGREAVLPEEREHVTPYLYRHPELFHIARSELPIDISHHRWTLDTPQDFEFLAKVFEQLPPRAFGWRDSLAVIERHPEWLAINSGVPQKSLNDRHE